MDELKTRRKRIADVLIASLMIIGVSGSLILVFAWYSSLPVVCKEWEQLNPDIHRCVTIRIEYVDYEPTGITRENIETNEGVIKEIGIPANFVVLANGKSFFVEPNGLYHSALPGDYVSIQYLRDYPTSCMITKIWLSNKTKFESSDHTQEELFKIVKTFPSSSWMIKPSGVLSKNDIELCGESHYKHIIKEILR